jgi:hypothetical protein
MRRSILALCIAIAVIAMVVVPVMAGTTPPPPLPPTSPLPKQKPNDVIWELLTILQNQITYLQNQLGNEINVRQAADTTLQTAIDAEATARIAGDASSQCTCPITETQYSDLITRISALEADTQCPEGYAHCGGISCDNLQSDPDNCGSCGTECSFPHAVATCTGGTCGLNACDSGWASCNSIIVDGCETSLTTLENCGGCGLVCSSNHANPVCGSPGCQLNCETNWANCNWADGDGCETSLTTLENCGGCGLRCAPYQGDATCTGGMCLIDCYDGYGNCNWNGRDGCEVDLQVNPSNCGSCYTVCPYGQSCISGVCQ